MVSTLERAAAPKVESLLAAAARAPRVSAVAAKLAWEQETGVFVDLRTPGSISIEGFEKIPSSQFAKSLAKLEEAAKNAGTKDIYFLDLTGYQSAQAVNILSEFPQFAGYNARVIDGGLAEWIADNGPYATTNSEIDALLQKLRTEADSGAPNDQYLQQLAADMGITPPQHDMLVLEEGTNNVVENPLVINDFTNQEAFRKFVQRTKL